MENGQNSFRELRKALKANKVQTAEKVSAETSFVKDRLSGKKFGVRENPWTIYEEDIYDFEKTFLRCLPEEYVELKTGERLKRYIEDTLLKGENKNGFVGVEFGGPGERFFEGFDGFFQKTAGVCLNDMYGNANIGRKFREENHTVIEGDIFDFKKNGTYKKLADALGRTRVNFIVSRMEGGLDSIFFKPPILLDRTIREWYGMLEENGIMLIQFERFEFETDPTTGISLTADRVSKWSRKIRETIPAIELYIEPAERQTLRLHKKPGAPEKLPSAKELFSN